MEIKVLGCSICWTDRFMSSYCIDDHILVDCGAGTFKSFKKNKLDENKVDHIFLTHFHNDHFDDVLIYLANIIDYKEPKDYKKLTIYGPKGLIKRINNLYNSTYIYDEPSSLNIGDYVNLVELNPFDEVEIGKYKVKAYPVSHGSYRNAYAYIFTEDDNNFGFSGDCTYDEDTVNFIKNSDNLILDCSNLKTSKYHLGYDKYLELKQQFSEKKMYLTHCANILFEHQQDYDAEFLKENQIIKFGK